MDWDKIWRKILYPPVWVAVLLAVFSTIGLILLFAKGWETLPFSYAVYVLAFYSLTVLCLLICAVFPKRYGAFKKRLYDHPIGNRYMTDAAFRTQVSLYSSLGINLLYVAGNVVFFILYRSFWFIILAGYYGILAVMRFLLLRYVRRNSIGANRLGELKRSRLCAAILLTVNIALSDAVLMILFQNKGHEYHGILIYIVAMFTFYITAHAIIDLIKYRKHGSPVMTMAKVISLSAALVSMLSLETAMLSQFGQEMAAGDRRMMIVLTGAGVSIAIITMAVFMIVRSAKEIRKIRGNENG